MGKMLRFHATHVGNRNAWFESFSLNFPEESPHMLLHAQNGTGKSTILSVYFSLFEARKDKFLQHLVDPDRNRFEDYFQPGRPHFAALELSLPNFRRVIIGHYVYNKPGSEIDRFWFLIKPTCPELEFSALPFYDNASGTNDRKTDGYIKTHEEAYEWRTRWQNEYRNGFQYVDKINAWEALLDLEGIDRKMNASQLMFNLSEGGMDRWLKVKSERDLVDNFLRLAITNDGHDPQGSALFEAYKNLQEAGTHLSSIPARRNQHQVLQNLQEELRHFKDLVAGMNSDQVATEAARDSFVSIAGEVLGLEAELTREVGELKEIIGINNSDIVRLQAEATEFRKIAASAARLIAELSVATAMTDLEAVKATILAAGRTIATARAAEVLTSLQATRNKISTLKAERKALEANSGNELAFLEDAGARLHAGLEVRIKELDAELESGIATLETVRTSIKTAQDSREAALSGAIAADAAADRLTNAESAAKDALTQLRKKKIILDQESPLEAAARLALTKMSAEANEERHAQQERQYQQDLTNLIGVQVANKALLKQHKLQLSTADGSKLAGDTLRQEIVKLPVVVDYAGTDYDGTGANIEPDNTGLSEALIKSADAARTAGILTAGKIQETESAIQFIKENGHATARPDVLHTLKAISNASTIWAVSAESYISENIHDEATARALIASDPARFTGIFVKADDIAKASLVRDALKLATFVVLSEPTLDAQAQGPSERQVLQPISAASFNKMAAVNELLRWKSEHQHLTDAKALQDRIVSDATQALAKIETWTRDYGSGRYQILIDEIASEKSAIEEIEVSIAAADDSLEAIRTSQTANTTALAAARSAIGTADLHMTAIDNWTETHSASLDASAKIETERRTAEELRATAVKLQDVIETIGDQATQIVRQLESAKIDRRSVTTEAAAVTYKSETTVVHSGEALADLRDSYKLRFDAYRNKAGDKINELQARIETEATHEGQYEIAYEKAKINLDHAEIEQVAASGAETALEDGVRSLDQAQRQQTEINVNIGRLKHELDNKRRDESSLGAHPDADSWTAEEIVQHARTAGDFAESAEEQAGKLYKANGQSQKRLDVIKYDMKDVASLLKRTQKHLVQMAVPPKLPSGNAAVITEAYERAEDVLADMSAKAQSATRKSTDSWSSIKRVATTEAFMRVEPQLSARIESLTPDEAFRIAETISALVEDRARSIVSEIQRSQADYDTCIEHMLSVAEQASNIIEEATSSSKIPEDVPNFGGMHIIKCNWSHTRITDSDKKARLQRLLDKWIADKFTPQDMWDFAAACLMAIANWDGNKRQDPLGIRCLKPKPELPEHDFVAKISFSGGEGLTIAIMLYLVVAQMRARTASGLRRNNEAGTLVLDNPMGKANRRDLIKIQIAIANGMGLQLIYSTGLNDEEAISTFDLITRFSNRGKKTINGADHVVVETATYRLNRDQVVAANNGKPEESTEAKAA